MSQQRPDDARRYVMLDADGRIVGRGTVRSLAKQKLVIARWRHAAAEQLKVRPETFLELLRSAGL